MLWLLWCLCPICCLSFGCLIGSSSVLVLLFVIYLMKGGWCCLIAWGVCLLIGFAYGVGFVGFVFGLLAFICVWYWFGLFGLNLFVVLGCLFWFVILDWLAVWFVLIWVVLLVFYCGLVCFGDWLFGFESVGCASMLWFWFGICWFGFLFVYCLWLIFLFEL